VRFIEKGEERKGKINLLIAVEGDDADADGVSYRSLSIHREMSLT